MTISPKASVESVKEQQGDEPLMYIINYPEGGWAIVSATKSFYPVLAYSDVGSFERTQDVSPVEWWLAGTQEAIKASEILDDSTRTTIRSMWSSYVADEASEQPVSTLRRASTIDEARSQRMSQLGSQYGYASSYRIVPLSSARNLFASEAEWMSLCNWANAQGSPPEYTIFVGRNDYPTVTVGPLLETHWGQGAPFNDLVPGGYSAGCAAVALAQILRYYQFPQSLSWNGLPINWSNVPIESRAGSAQAALVSLVGSFVNTHYASFGSWTLPGDLESGIRDMGYSVTRADHNPNTVKTQLLTYRRPVIMGGGDLNLPNPLNYIGKGHFWVCDGARDYKQNLTYFLELINRSNNTYYTHPHIYNPSNLFVSQQYASLNFHMNWGWNGDKDGWFLHYDVNPKGTNYDEGREDFYITKP